MMMGVKQIAEALNLTRPAVVMRANREAWPHTLEAVRGGWRKVFTLSELPQEVAYAVFQYHRTEEKLSSKKAAKQIDASTVLTPRRLRKQPCTVTIHISGSRDLLALVKRLKGRS